MQADQAEHAVSILGDKDLAVAPHCKQSQAGDHRFDICGVPQLGQQFGDDLRVCKGCFPYIRL
jgi:hypothetical protein